MFQVQLGWKWSLFSAVEAVPPHRLSPSNSKLFKMKQNKAGGCWKEQEFVSENENELLWKACLGDGFRDSKKHSIAGLLYFCVCFCGLFNSPEDWKDKKAVLFLLENTLLLLEAMGSFMTYVHQGARLA